MIYQFKYGTRGDALCWRCSVVGPIPDWVALDFSWIADKGLVHRTGYLVKEGDWIVLPFDKLDTATVLTDAEFHEMFLALPEHVTT